MAVTSLRLDLLRSVCVACSITSVPGFDVPNALTGFVANVPISVEWDSPILILSCQSIRVLASVLIEQPAEPR